MKKKAVSVFAVISFIIFTLVYAVLIFAKSSYKRADLINDGIAEIYRKIMASVTTHLPFSVFELLLMVLPIVVLILIVVAVRKFRNGEGAIRFTVNFVAVVLLIISGHNLALGVGYRATPIDKKMGMSSVEVTEDALAELLITLRDDVNELSCEVEYNSDGSSRSPHTLDGACSLILRSYDNISEKYGLPEGFESRVKPVRFSNVMSYFGVTGIYTYYTGEANVNVSYPDYDTVFTAAHELSHQRGVLREDEANFMAYLMCSSSDDAYLRYSAALNLYQYVASALYRTNPDLYREIALLLCDGAKGDILASRAVNERYGGTVIEDISRFINDLFLKSNGADGVIAYGKVVRLAVAYYNPENQR